MTATKQRPARKYKLRKCARCGKVKKMDGPQCSECYKKHGPTGLREAQQDELNRIARKAFREGAVPLGMLPPVLPGNWAHCPCGGVRVVDEDMRIVCRSCGRDSWILVNAAEQSNPEGERYGT